MGYHNLFFPGGTRSRSGEVEQKLKRGLLGTAINAYVHNLQAQKEKPNIYLIPATLSYKLVLEAETLIGDHLKAVGKSRYIIEDDEFSKPRRILNFMSNAVSLEEKIVLTFSEPLDIFGNRVDAEGRSLDPRGRFVDPKGYVCRAGQPVFDAQRDRQFTSEAADEIGRSYLRDNVLMSTNVVARAVLDLLREQNPELDMYRLLRTGGKEASFPLLEVHKRTERLLDELKALPDGPRFGEELLGGDIQEIVADAVAHFSIYHTQPAAVRRGDRLFHQDRNLLFYYGNRLEGYGLRLNGQGGQ
jgi:glycerol-3-phosphate O-acyltransferase